MEAVIYPSNIKTDKDKLFAVYSLIEQMRLEHNKVAAIARKEPDKYLKTGKFRTYARESKKRLKEVLAEQNRLREKIRWDNYTLEEWKAISKLPLEEQDTIHLNLFGDRGIERIKSTKATSPVLNELKALNLDDMLEKLGTDPTENFTTYTEVDEGEDITKTADRITFTAVETRSDTYYVYKDKLAAHFSGDFEHLEKVLVSAIVNNADVITWLISNDIADFWALYLGDKDFLTARFYRSADVNRLGLGECDGGDWYNDPSVGVSTGTVYFLEIERDEAVGDHGTAYIYICTTDYWDDGGDQVDTLTLTLHTSKKDYQYIYGLSSADSAGSYQATGYVELLDLQEAEGWTNISHVKGIAAASISHKKGVAVADISHVKGVEV